MIRHHIRPLLNANGSRPRSTIYPPPSRWARPGPEREDSAEEIAALDPIPAIVESEEGTRYVSGVPAGNAAELRRLDQEGFARYDLPGHFSNLEKHRLDALYATRMYIEETNRAHARLQQRQEAARSAQADFPSQIQDLQTQRNQAAERHLQALQKERKRLRRLEKQMTKAMQQPGVPVTAVIRYLEWRSQGGPAMTTPGEVAFGPPDTTSPTPEEAKEGWGMTAWLWGSRCVTGSLVGLCLGLELQFLELDSLTRFRLPDSYWALPFAGVGVGTISLLSHGLSALWHHAGRLSGRDATNPATGFLDWYALRHTLFPFALTGFIAAIEACVIGNGIARSPSASSQLLWAYYLGALPCIVPTALASAASGWKKGRRVGEREAAERDRAVAARDDAFAGAGALGPADIEAQIAESPEAQAVLALAYRAEILREQVARREAEIDALIRPYQRLQELLEEGICVPQELSLEEKERLHAGMLASVAANQDYSKARDELAHWLEPRNGYEGARNEGRRPGRGDAGWISTPEAPDRTPRLPAAWQRLIDFVDPRSRWS